MPTTRHLALAALTCLWPLESGAVECRAVAFDGAPFTVCTVDPTKETLRLFLTGPEGRPLATFKNVDEQLATTGHRLAFAMNAGMYHADRSPVGLYVENGTQVARLVTRGGGGNFGLLPNGIFCLTGTSAEVIETHRFAQSGKACDYATQSGPMLVIDGQLHPRFLPASDSLNLRNGVGIAANGNAVFAISDVPVNFHHFARLFRDELGTRNALYLDGSISRLHAPALGRSDPGFPMGPIVGVVE